MNAELVLKHFNYISDAPEAIRRFRQFIIDLSVRGKLVEQDPSDEPAFESLKRVRSERKRLSKEKIVKNDKISGEIQALEKPYSLPGNWQWIRLGECLDMINGRAFKPTDWIPSGLPIVRIQNLNTENAPFNYCNESIVEQRHIIESGCFLISWSGTPGTSFGAFIWKRGKAALNQHIFRCVQVGGAYYDRFLQIAINGRLDEMIAKAHGGVGLQHITKGKLENLPLSLPPLAEQYRIVSKVDELMALCDRLEMARTERESRRDQLAAASHHHLNNGADSKVFRKHTHFFIGHLPQLTVRSDQIKKLRQTILDLAVQGKLGAQNPSDEPAEDLLERIQTRKASLLGNATIRQTKACRSFDPNDVPHSIPSSWKWTMLGEITDIGTGSTPSRTQPSFWDGSIPWVTSGSTSLSLISSGDEYVTEAAVKAHRLRLYQPGTLLVGLYGQGKTRGQVAELGIESTINQACAAVCPLPGFESVHPYLKRLLQKNYDEVRLLSAGGTQPNLNVQKIKELLVPLPPIPEQARIVAKVDELMALCDRLEAQLTTAQTEASRLLESVLHHALASSGIDPKTSGPDLPASDLPSATLKPALIM
jgi:type I restriction enzyme S subunit